MSRREVLACLKQLTAQGYVKIEEKNICVCLTELGRIRGEECRHRHETFTQLLEYVGVESRIAEEDACRMEHVVSDETVQQICNFVNYGSTFEHAQRCFRNLQNCRSAARSHRLPRAPCGRHLLLQCGFLLLHIPEAG